MATPYSPELLPVQAGENEMIQPTEQLIGPYELHDFFLYHMIYGKSSPEKVFYLASVAFAEKYNQEIIKTTMKQFVKRFFSQQFKRNCMPDGPKVGCISLSPRGEWRMPSDAVGTMWLRAIDALK